MMSIKNKNLGLNLLYVKDYYNLVKKIGPL